jgi:hypothetical protein
MPTEDELKKKCLTELAVLCQQVAKDTARYTEAWGAEASKLRKEWVSLQTPPDPDLRKQRKTEAQLAALKKRMAEFLARIL